MGDEFSEFILVVFLLGILVNRGRGVDLEGKNGEVIAFVIWSPFVIDWVVEKVGGGV